VAAYIALERQEAQTPKRCDYFTLRIHVSAKKMDLHFTRAGAPIEIAMYVFLIVGNMDSLDEISKYKSRIVLSVGCEK
jgi:hypothetical protein